MKQPKPITIDFETDQIRGRPFYPPVPVGVSIKSPGKKAKYYAWGHITENNSTWAEAQAALAEAYKHPDGLLFQNGKFDVDVAEVHMDLPVPKWQQIHDTMFLLFLDDPHQTELGLKPSAARLLNLPADEQDAVGEWLIKHQPVPGVNITRGKGGPHYFGKYIAYAPGQLVGKYANGDTERTEALFKLLWPKTVEREMLGAYDRERRLMPILLEMERQGIQMDHAKLRQDVAMYNEWRAKIDAWLIKRMKAPADINFNSGAELVDAMIKSGVADEHLMPRTPTGKFQTNKEALLVGVVDKVVLAMLKYRTQLNTCLNTFMQPWLATADASGGLIFTTWNQIKAPAGDASVGTRTGRLSSTPNFQNIPKEFSVIWAHEDPKNKKLPKCPFKDLPPLPQVRTYITPFKGEIFVDRDYSQQEPRILAHFDAGALLEKYLENPWIDFHDFAQAELAKMGKIYDRKPVKNTNLGLIYGMGVGKLALKNDMSVEESGELKKAILLLYPGLKEMYQDMKVRAQHKQPIRTWGGREYYCEEPRIVDGRIRQFDYKLVNVLIQGSAADCTKEAIIRFDDIRIALKKPQWKPVLNVHDQITVSVPIPERDAAMEQLRIAMEGVEFDVPMLSEGAISLHNWGALEDFDKKGKQVYGTH